MYRTKGAKILAFEFPKLRSMYKAQIYKNIGCFNSHFSSPLGDRFFLATERAGSSKRALRWDSAEGVRRQGQVWTVLSYPLLPRWWNPPRVMEAENNMCFPSLHFLQLEFVCLVFFFFFFLGLDPRHMEVPRSGVEL